MNVYELTGEWLNALGAEATIKKIPGVITGAPTAVLTPELVNAVRVFAINGAAYAGSISVQEAGIPLANTAYSVYKLNWVVPHCAGNVPTIGRDDGIIAATYQPVTVYGASAVSLASPTSAIPFALDLAADPKRIDIWDYYGMYNHVHPTGYNSHGLLTAWISYRGMMLPARQYRVVYI